MSQVAAHLVDKVLPHAPVRQWVVTFPFDVRFKLAFDTEFCSRAIRIVDRAISGWMRRRGRDYLELGSVKHLRTGGVTFIQRWRSDLALAPHLHVLMVDGVYLEEVEQEPPVFRAIPAPTRAEVEGVAGRIAKRLRRLATADDDGQRELFESEPLLAACGAASIQRRIATGPRSGDRVRALGKPQEQAARTTPTGLCAQVEGVNVHAGVRVRAAERSRLEHLVRYVARSPVATQRLRLTDDGDVIYDFKRPWSDGTCAVRLSPIEFIEKLAALVPRPWSNQHRYYGALAPNSRIRRHIVPSSPVQRDRRERKDANSYWIPWADLLKRVFDVDISVCPRCGGAMRVIACIMEREAIRTILQSHESHAEPGLVAVLPARDVAA